jgi:7-carboxy-7-deazaguanine synthase
VVSLQTVSREVGYVSEMFVSYQGEGARVGEKHLFVRFAGCNLRCRYCDTPASLVRVPTCEITFPGGEVVSVPNPLSIVDIAVFVERFFSEDPGIACVSLTGGEPMLQQRFISSWLRTARPPVGCMLETAATVAGGLDELLPLIDMVSADIKLPSNSGEGPLWHHHRQFFAKCGGTDVYLKMPVCDGTDEEQVRAGARLARETIPGATLYLQPITDPEGGAWQARPSRLLALLAAAAAETSRVMLLPQMHKLLAIR